MGTATANAASSEAVRALIAPYAHEVGGPITALRALQQERGWIDDEAAAAVAYVFNLSRAEVRGLLEFYSDFRSQPPVTHTVAICQAEACQAAGSRELTRAIAERFGIGLGGATADRSVGLEPVYCLGLCARAPAMRVDDELVVEADQAVERVLADLPS